MQASTKDWILYSTAIAMIASAIILAFLDFFITNTIGEGVLWYVSESLVYAGSIFGVSIYFRTKFGDFESKTTERINKEIDTLTERLTEKMKNKEI